MILRKAFVAISIIGLTACNSSMSPKEEAKNQVLKEGSWQATIHQNDSTDLKFNFNVSNLNDSLSIAEIRNAEERLEAKVFRLAADSFKIEMPVFANYFLVKLADNQFKGFYINPDASDDYRLAFSAKAGVSERYENTQHLFAMDGFWKVVFNPGTEDEYLGKAYFKWDEAKGVYGTIMTATGDYRYLEGSGAAGQLQMSAFDGAHLFTFKAELHDTLRGHFYSGRSYYAPWIAYRDSSFTLPDPDTLTYIKEGYDGFDFAFPNLEGDTISLGDEQFAGKPIIIQISGSWCPNCYDESRYLSEVFQKYNAEGLEIVCLSFERTHDYETAQRRLAKMQKDLEMPYTVLLAGATRDDKAAEKLPMLNHIMSYPTAIYLDKNHQVRKIHTGFSGPGTPVWEDFVSENDAFLQKLLNE